MKASIRHTEPGRRSAPGNGFDRVIEGGVGGARAACVIGFV